MEKEPDWKEWKFPCEEATWPIVYAIDILSTYTAGVAHQPRTGYNDDEPSTSFHLELLPMPHPA